MKLPENLHFACQDPGSAAYKEQKQVKEDGHLEKRGIKMRRAGISVLPMAGTGVALLGAAVIWSAFAASSYASITTMLSSSGNPDENRNDWTGTVGTRFQTGADSLKVISLGFEDTGFSTSHQVGLWTDLGGLVASTTVVGTDALVGQWRFAALGSSVILAPNTIYRLGGETLAGGDPFTDDYSGDGIINFGLNAPLTTIGAVINDYSGGPFSAPLSDGLGTAFRWAPANAQFEAVPKASVPEPVSLVIWSLLAGLAVAYGWRRRRAA